MNPYSNQTAMFYQMNPLAWAFHRATAHALSAQSPAKVTPSANSPNAEYVRAGQMKEYLGVEKQALPVPEHLRGALGKAIAERRSCRRFANTALPFVSMSTLLHGAYGLGAKYLHGTLEMFDRPVPSGGGCYPLELYVLAQNIERVATGVHHYSIRHRALELIGPLPQPEAIVSLFLGQSWLAKAHAIVVITAVAPRLLERYGDRGYRYLLIEAGHVGQNLALLATAMGLGSLSLGGFYDDEVACLLGLDPAFEIPLYGVALGVPDTPDSAEARGLT